MFILNENRAYLGEKIGDILNAVHDLEQEGANMGARQMIKFSEKIVSRIRRILHSNWPQTEETYLKSLQKVGVALMKAIEEKNDLRELMPQIKQELEDVSGKLGVPVNTLAAPEGQESPENPPEGEPGQQQQQQQDVPPPPEEIPDQQQPGMQPGAPPPMQGPVPGATMMSPPSPMPPA